MFKKEQTYINESKTPSSTGAVVILKTVEASSNKSTKLFASILLILFVALLSFQINFVYASQDSNSPITSPVTTPVLCAAGQTSIIVNGQLMCLIKTNPGQTQTQQNVFTGSASVSSNNQPITSPENSPSPSPSSTPIASPENNPNNGGSSNGGSNGGGGLSAPSTPSCNDQKPNSAPKLFSAVSTGKNEVTLSWEKAKDPVSHYIVSYGLQEGKPLYGNPNVGNVSSYKVKGLSGATTYFFRVRAVNNCTPGDPSNELSVKIGGKTIFNQPAQDFQAGGVLGAQINTSPKPSVSPSVLPSLKPATSNNSQPQGLLSKIFQAIIGFFSK